ncbi:MAG TPA: hypothetical protein VGP86_16100, partial [Xanthobacteraceae bacterium]|nr:hypothetical protein [Xanthobacteraceae bacterium]
MNHRFNSRERTAFYSVQPGTWVTLLTDDVGNTFLVSFRSALVVVVALPVDPVGNAFLRCPQV